MNEGNNSYQILDFFMFIVVVLKHSQRTITKQCFVNSNDLISLVPYFQNFYFKYANELLYKYSLAYKHNLFIIFPFSFPLLNTFDITPITRMKHTQAHTSIIPADGAVVKCNLLRLDCKIPFTYKKLNYEVHTPWSQPSLQIVPFTGFGW